MRTDVDKDCETIVTAYVFLLPCSHSSDKMIALVDRKPTGSRMKLVQISRNRSNETSNFSFFPFPFQASFSISGLISSWNPSVFLSTSTIN